MSQFGFKGTGKVFLDILDDSGLPTGLQLKGNCKSFSIKGDSETEEITSTDRDDFGTVLFSDTIPKPHTVDFVFNGFDIELFAAGFGGVSTTLTQASGATGGSPIAVTAIADRFVEIGKRMISAVVVKNVTDATTYVLGTDYTINERLGMICALSGGSIGDGDVLHVECSFAAINGSRVSGATKSNVYARIMIDGQERSSNRDFIFHGKKVRLASTTEIALLGDKFVEAAFSGKFEKPADGTAIYDLDFLS